MDRESQMVQFRQEVARQGHPCGEAHGGELENAPFPWYVRLLQCLQGCTM